MTQDGWREVVRVAVHRADDGVAGPLDILAQLLAEQDTAKNTLREEGFGVLGTPWPELVEEITLRLDTLYERER